MSSSSMSKDDKIDSTILLHIANLIMRDPPQTHLELIISEKATQNHIMSFATCNKNTWRVIQARDTANFSSH
jgi:hypothetical protein